MLKLMIIVSLTLTAYVGSLADTLVVGSTVASQAEVNTAALNSQIRIHNIKAQASHIFQAMNRYSNNWITRTNETFFPVDPAYEPRSASSRYLNLTSGSTSNYLLDDSLFFPDDEFEPSPTEYSRGAM